MTRLLRCGAGWYAAWLALPLSFLPFSPSAQGGGADPFAGLSKEVLIPENPYLFVNSLTLWNGIRKDHLKPGLGEGNFDLYELGLEADLHWGKLNPFGSAAFGWDAGQDAGSLDLRGGLGYDIDLTVTGVQITPLAGYASSQLDRDGRFDAAWEGPFLGTRLEVPLAEQWLLQASYFYHWASFEAELAPVAAMNRADGGGHTSRLDVVYRCNERIDLKLGAEIRSYASEAGSFSRTEAAWESWSVKFGVAVKF